MARRTKTLWLEVKVTSPAKMTAAQVRREFRERINEIGGYDDSYSLGLDDDQKLRAAVRPMPREDRDGLTARSIRSDRRRRAALMFGLRRP
jgi:hypothetical protein